MKNKYIGNLIFNIKFEKIKMIFFSLFFFLFIIPNNIWAQEENYLLSKNQTLETTKIVSAKSITIDGNINGDLICAGQDITINGSISGDVLCLGQNINVLGNIDGNLRTISQYLDTKGRVNRNISIIAQKVNFDKDAKLLGEVFFAGQNVSIQGYIKKQLLGCAEDVKLSGQIDGDVYLNAKKTEVTETANILGKLDYVSNSKLNISNENIIKKGAFQHLPPVKKDVDLDIKKIEDNSFTSQIKSKILSIIYFLIFALILIFFIPEKVINASKLIDQKKSEILGKGFLFLLLFPLLIGIVFITIIGIPLALLGALFYVFIIFYSQVVFAIYLGNRFFSFYFKKYANNLTTKTIVGIVLFKLLIEIPILNFFILLAGVILGTGASVLAYQNKK